MKTRSAGVWPTRRSKTRSHRSAPSDSHRRPRSPNRQMGPSTSTSSSGRFVGSQPKRLEASRRAGIMAFRRGRAWADCVGFQRGRVQSNSTQTHHTPSRLITTHHGSSRGRIKRRKRRKRIRRIGRGVVFIWRCGVAWGLSHAQSEPSVTSVTSVTSITHTCTCPSVAPSHVITRHRASSHAITRHHTPSCVLACLCVDFDCIPTGHSPDHLARSGTTSDPSSSPLGSTTPR